MTASKIERKAMVGIGYAENISFHIDLFARQRLCYWRAIGEKEIDDALFGPALDFSDFRNMQKLEAAGEFGSKILQPRDREDRETFKVRQGKVGGFRQSLSSESQHYAEEICAALDPRF